MRLFKMKTRQMVDKSFSQHMIYQVFRAITHDIFNDKTWFPRPDVHARMSFMRYSAS